MEGKVSKGFCNAVRLQMLTRESYLTAEDWTKKFISCLLQITHGQWLYRNSVVHERMSGGLTRIEQEDILTRIEEQFNQCANDLEDEDRYLLEVDFETLWDQRGSTKKYWLRAIESA